MKRIKNIIMLLTLTFMLTGCVKYNGTMTINKDKSMNIDIIYAFDTSVFGSNVLSQSDDESKSKFEKQGYTVTEYSDDKYEGYKLHKSIKNIDDVSTDNNPNYSLSDYESDNKYMFQIKRGLLKNTYIAKFKFDSNDSDLNTDTSDSSDVGFTANENETKYTVEPLVGENSDTGVTYGEIPDDEDIDLFGSDDTDTTGLDDLDMSALTQGMDLKFTVKLPYAAKSSNATTKNNGNKELIWNLNGMGAETIEFEFEIINPIILYGLIGLGVLVVIIIVVLIAKKSKKKKDTVNNGNVVNNGPVQSLDDASQTLGQSIEPTTFNQTPPVQEQPQVTEQQFTPSAPTFEQPQITPNVEVTPQVNEPVVSTTPITPPEVNPTDQFNQNNQ